ncbi:MAG: TetR/AcrR family transcriptional regulator [Pseudomonadota bacterium]
MRGTGDRTFALRPPRRGNAGLIEVDGAQPNGQTKATRGDWLNAARDVLVSEGVGEVKVLALSHRLDVSRSSFYWYFKNRQDLLDELLLGWEARNTRTIVERCAAPAKTITGAVCNFFTCFVDPRLFDCGLDFAIREWARREAPVRLRIDAADTTRIAAVTKMFARHGYDASDADTRARILYFMQLGYHALDVREDMALRLSRVEGYVRGFTGAEPDASDLSDFLSSAETVGQAPQNF